ncbi:Guanine nucleotide-binding protein alpha-2 subunit [Neolecta irregularis DAH-3]|uniref:Guanine nucleotide-binding protein alpha-2 subunit n=1 Tax=Neolecta irregularis (strain DAH-3) TaxID=1198029 RepID=A0A1U7LQU2_NEOID|nr:Guanine nucleotide-binding protein alpha-2 subunit [Neolecta irregularis DAH-3]|eukprot:OLL24922.1 Guanine nucleotide-binding protein alpha-2 subunit [Neolecta irregularis DAH-3]
MGCVPSKSDPDTQKSRYLDRIIKNDEKRMAQEVKILLLGAGESGKTTILKQMKLIHATGFSTLERETYKTIVFSNILHSLRLVIEAMADFNIQLQVPSNMGYIDLIATERELGRRERFPPEYLDSFKALWADSGVQATVQRGHEYALHDNLSYFFDSIDRVFQPNYIPSDQDILRCRMKTTGITETLFHLGDLNYRMFDVGGQRSERKKWIHCFESVTALMFLVAISGYDQCLVEDREERKPSTRSSNVIRIDLQFAMVY